MSVPDPYDVISPFHDWGPVPVTAQTLAKALHVVGTVADVTTTLNLSGRVSQLDLTTLTPSSTFPLLSTVAANTVQGALGLRSTWFDVGVLSLSPPIPSLPVLYGSTVQLSGVVRGVDGVSLEQRPSVRHVAAGRPGRHAAGRNGAADGDPDDHDGLPAGDDAGRRGVRADQGHAASSRWRPRRRRRCCRARSRPRWPDAPVQIQQLDPSGITWTTVATGTVDPTVTSTTGATGTFTVPLPLTAGTYRAVIAPGHGYSPGTSAPVTVSG